MVIEFFIDFQTFKKHFNRYRNVAFVGMIGNSIQARVVVWVRIFIELSQLPAIKINGIFKWSQCHRKSKSYYNRDKDKNY